MENREPDTPDLNQSETTILIVDDKPDNLKLLSKILTEDNFHVKATISGKLALQTAQANPPALILLDIKMPEMNGYEVCKRLKANKDTAGIPVIFISALEDLESKTKAFEVGGVDYINKPFQSEEVLARVKNHVALWQMRQQLEERVKQRTAELDQKNEALRKNEERLQAIMDNTGTIIYLKNLQGQYQLINNQYEKVHHITKEEVIGKSDYELFPKEIADLFRSNDLTALEAGTSMQFEEISPLDDGNHTYVAIKFPLYDTSGEPYGICGISTDITDRIEKEEEIRKLNKELEIRVAERTAELEKKTLAAEAANRAKSEFLANMSHEIRTPMNAILGFSQILEKLIVDEEHRGYLHSISTSGKALLTLINDILDLSKIEAGKLELEYAAINPQLVFQEMKQIFSHKIAEKGLEFHLEIDPKLPQFLILDEVRLRQILLNLVGNAVKFTEKGVINLSVSEQLPKETESSDRESSDRESSDRESSDRGPAGRLSGAIDLILSVEDTGIGIPPDQLELIFESFEQQKGVSHIQYGGTGLGLSITKRLVGIMGGYIQVTSKVGSGSIFKVVLENITVADLKRSEEPLESITDNTNSFLKHTLTEDKLEGGSTVQEKDDVFEKLDSANMEKLPEFLKMLEAEVSTCEILAQTMAVREIGQFAVRAENWGTEYHYPPLISWGKRLHTHADKFDVKPLRKALELFPSHIQKIHSLLSHSQMSN